MTGGRIRARAMGRRVRATATGGQVRSRAKKIFGLEQHEEDSELELEEEELKLIEEVVLLQKKHQPARL